MGLLDFFKNGNTDSSENIVSYGPSAIDSFFGGSTKISEEEALQIPAVTAAIDLISGSIAQLQFSLIKKNENTGEVIRNSDDHRLRLLNKQPNETMDAYTFKKMMVKDYLLYGASNAVIERNLNKVTGLYSIPTKNISVQVFVRNGYKKYSVTTLNSASGSKKFNDYQLLTVLRNSDDGLTGKGILEQHHDVLSLALSETKYAKNILQNGALPVGVLKSQQKLTEPAFNRLKASWANLYAGADKAGKTVILEEGLDYTPISMKPNELQLTETKKATLADTARIFNIPESMLNANANKYGSNEQNNLLFLQYCISPILSAIENAVNKELLLESEKEQGYTFKLDPSILLQTTRKDRAEAVGAEYKEGLISFWEARNEIDRPKTVEDDYFKLSLGAVLYKYETDEMIIPNTMGSKASLEKEEKEVKHGQDLPEEGIKDGGVKA